MGFRIAAGKLQSEMMGVFVRELLAHPEDAERSDEQLRLLASALEDAVERLTAARSELDSRLGAVLRASAEVCQHLEVFRALEVNGRLEAARASDAGDVRELFRSIGEQVGEARVQMAQFTAVQALHGARSSTDAREQVARVRAALAA